MGRNVALGDLNGNRAWLDLSPRQVGRSQWQSQRRAWDNGPGAPALALTSPDWIANVMPGSARGGPGLARAR